MNLKDWMRVLLIRIVRKKAPSFDAIPNALTAKTLRKSARGEDVYYTEDAATLFKDLLLRR